MKKFKLGIIVNAEDSATAQKLGNLLQRTVDKVENDDIIPLLEKVAKKPGIVKTALKYI